MIRALFLLGVVLLVSSLVWMAVGGHDVPKKTWVEFVDPEHPSFDPGQVQLRVQTFDIPPVNRTCATRDASGGYTVNLNAKGESYFGTHKDDVNAAIEESLLEAETALLAMANDADWCENQCAAVQGFGNAIVDDAIATASLIIGAYETGDPKCDPTSVGGVSPGITINAQAPGTPGVNVLAALLSVDISGADGIDISAVNAFNKFREDVIAEFDLIVPITEATSPDSQSGTLTLKPSGYFANGKIAVTHYNYDYVSFNVMAPPGVPGVDNFDFVEFTVYFNYQDGTLTLGNTVNGSGFWSAWPVPKVIWGGAVESDCPGIMPTSISFFNDDDPPPREINETIPLINSPDPETWEVEPSFNDNPTTRLFADEAVTIAYSYYQVQLSPGVYEKRENLFYRNIKPFLPLCMDLQEMHHVALPETEFDPENSPPCVRRILPRPDLILA